jgi:hypothetical protein
LGPTYSVEFWFWNGLPHDARPVTGYLFSRGRDGDASAAGDHLGIGGTHAAGGRLIFFNGNGRNQVLAGRTPLRLRTWNHVVLVRDGHRVRVELNGRPEPEIVGELEVTHPPGVGPVFVGGRCDGFANFEGRVDEMAVYGRGLKAAEVSTHVRAAAIGPMLAAIPAN